MKSLFRYLMIFKIFCISLLVGTIASCATVNEKDLKALKIGASGLYYESVTPVDGASSLQLYERALVWMALNYKSVNDVIQLQDKENKRIIGKGVFLVPFISSSIPVSHTISFEAREGRYKIRFDDLNAVPKTGGTWEISKAQGIQTQIVSGTENAIMSAVSSLERAIKTPETEKNW